MTDLGPVEGIAVGLFETREFSRIVAARGAQVVACPLIFPESPPGHAKVFSNEERQGSSWMDHETGEPPNL
jgi:hypothetical protein